MAFNTRSFLTGPIPTPQRVLGIANNVAGFVNYLGNATPVKKLLGFAAPAYLKVGTGAAGFLIQCGGWIPAEKGINMSLVINSASGSLTVSSNGLDISVTPASGGSHAAAVVAAINAQFSPNFVLATLLQGSAGGTNVAALTKTFFVQSDRFPALP